MGIEHHGIEEAEQGIHGAFVGETEAADLVALESIGVVVEEADSREAEHSDFVVHIPQMWNLEDLLNAFKAGVLAGAEFSLGRIDFMAAVAGKSCLSQDQADERHIDAVRRTRSLEEILSGLLG